MHKNNMCLSDVLTDIAQTRIALYAHSNDTDLIISWFEKRNTYFMLLPEVINLINYAHTLKQKLLT